MTYDELLEQLGDERAAQIAWLQTHDSIPPWVGDHDAHVTRESEEVRLRMRNDPAYQKAAAELKPMHSWVIPGEVYAEQLRTAITKASKTYRPGLSADQLQTLRVDAVMAIFHDPKHHPAFLNLIGDVREGYARFFAGGAWSAHDEPLMNGEPVYVVRPRGEATDE